MVTIKERKKKKQSDSLFPFMLGVIEQLKAQGKERTSETYTAALKSFTKFRQGKDILLTDLTTDEMESYEAYLLQKGACLNTVSFYLRILRATYNRAVDRGLTEQKRPFRHVYTGQERTMKRALPLATIKRIKNMVFNGEPMLEYARDLFLLSFYLRGMAFVDMAYLEKKNLRNGVLTYRRKKTRQQLYIKWEPCMQEIINKYPTPAHSPYLLPIIRMSDRSPRNQYYNASHVINRKLKEIGLSLHLPLSLTMYVARHSWASIARSKNIPLAVISESLGHDSEKTTLIYLASLNSAVVDRANRLILRSL